MLTLPESLDVFYLEHRRCGDLDGGVQGDVVWLACESCGVQLARPVVDAPPPSADPRASR
jgi:hypothetical protein